MIYDVKETVKLVGKVTLGMLITASFFGLLAAADLAATALSEALSTPGNTLPPTINRPL